jgi:hypothetical protein
LGTPVFITETPVYTATATYILTSVPDKDRQPEITKTLPVTGDGDRNINESFYILGGAALLGVIATARILRVGRRRK